jgi:hypothetical protein
MAEPKAAVASARTMGGQRNPGGAGGPWRGLSDGARRSAATRNRPHPPPSPGSSAGLLARLADLRERGVITAEEFDREKAKILA